MDSQVPAQGLFRRWSPLRWLPSIPGGAPCGWPPRWRWCARACPLCGWAVSSPRVGRRMGNFSSCNAPGSVQKLGVPQSGQGTKSSWMVILAIRYQFSDEPIRKLCELDDCAACQAVTNLHGILSGKSRRGMGFGHVKSDSPWLRTVPKPPWPTLAPWLTRRCSRTKRSSGCCVLSCCCWVRIYPAN